MTGVTVLKPLGSYPFGALQPGDEKLWNAPGINTSLLPDGRIEIRLGIEKSGKPIIRVESSRGKHLFGLTLHGRSVIHQLQTHAESWGFDSVELGQAILKDAKDGFNRGVRKVGFPTKQRLNGVMCVQGHPGVQGGQFSLLETPFGRSYKIVSESLLSVDCLANIATTLVTAPLRAYAYLQERIIIVLNEIGEFRNIDGQL